MAFCWGCRCSLDGATFRRDVGCIVMGRCTTSAEAMTAVGETAARRAPKIYYLQHGHSDGAADWSRLIGQAAALGFDHVCAAPIFVTDRDPFLIADLEAADPKLGLGSTPEEAVGMLASFCDTHGVRLFLDIVLDRLAAGGPSVHKAEGLYEQRDQSEVMDPRHSWTFHAAPVRTDMEQQLAAWWAERLVRLVRAGAAGLSLRRVGQLFPSALFHNIPNPPT